ncbi:transposase [Micromonospora rhizosphaerae]|uniref:transposase n=1 Tax=Micromonospora rhizosphaerae TaxID=568872 RepID=UPI001C401798
MLIVARDNIDRVRSEPAWARLCGVAPVPASSGMTNRHRLSLGEHSTDGQLRSLQFRDKGVGNHVNVLQLQEVDVTVIPTAGGEIVGETV